MSNNTLPPIETDPDDPTRVYIPLPGGWEMQTRGCGSSFRICDTKTGDRHLLEAHGPVPAFLEKMAREIREAYEKAAK